eukprot:CAMPEP_0202493856 /NCGR_PEP_ID=MMETSP1361-20130828/10029_1 /ASSEMBLY_ACC=CAM_ASM_000849 /TAXON_ID=210615 /ORGANISM="Staurosira complex sp., Strain CCMP2646" /LENGTH=80 /DNA_ID=CAMNT_0049124217 /DNA_START=1009 /DNA_END=1251 /DNA_ORIENTATION=+
MTNERILDLEIAKLERNKSLENPEKGSQILNSACSIEIDSLKTCEPRMAGCQTMATNLLAAIQPDVALVKCPWHGFESGV